jgi:phage gpG-like protein
VPTGTPSSANARRVAEGNILSAQSTAQIREKANRLLRETLGALAIEEIDRLLEKQTEASSAIRLSSAELQALAVRYAERVRRVAGSLARDLAQAVGGRRRGLGKGERDWIEREVSDFTARWTSTEVASDFLRTEIAAHFTVENEREAAPVFGRNVAGLHESGHLARYARIELDDAQAIYGRARRRSAKHKATKKPGRPRTAVGKTPLVANPWDSLPDIVKRRAIVHQHLKLSSKDLCKKLDSESVPVPDGWMDRFKVQDWRGAYLDKQCRRLIHKLISSEKPKVR